VAIVVGFFTTFLVILFYCCSGSNEGARPAPHTPHVPQQQPSQDTKAKTEQKQKPTTTTTQQEQTQTEGTESKQKDKDTATKRKKKNKEKGGDDN